MYTYKPRRSKQYTEFLDVFDNKSILICRFEANDFLNNARWLDWSDSSVLCIASFENLHI